MGKSWLLHDSLGVAPKGSRSCSRGHQRVDHMQRVVILQGQATACRERDHEGTC